MDTTCHGCGVKLDLSRVQRNPFQKCPVCGAPLDKNAADHVFVEAANPTDARDVQRDKARAQLHADVAQHAQKSATTSPATKNPFPGR